MRVEDRIDIKLRDLHLREQGEGLLQRIIGDDVGMAKEDEVG